MNDGHSIQMMTKIIFVESSHWACLVFFSQVEIKLRLFVDFRLNSKLLNTDGNLCFEIRFKRETYCVISCVRDAALA